MQLESEKYFNGSFLKKNTVLYRHYQKNIANSCKNKNSLVILPTGLGKTLIGILLVANALKKYPKAKILILAPTRPLVSQHKASCQKFLSIDSENIVSFTGKISPEKRIILFRTSKIIISTPQVINNDISRGRYDLSQVALIIFDEAHKTKGKYSYNTISTEYVNTCNDPLILGLTASPGKDYERIQEICNNLYIENIIFRTYEDDDVNNIHIRNCNIRDNGEEGIYLDGLDTDGTFMIHCNNIGFDNDIGLGLISDTFVDARDNWWGDASGPDHPDNPDGTGDSVEDQCYRLVRHSRISSMVNPTIRESFTL